MSDFEKDISNEGDDAGQQVGQAVVDQSSEAGARVVDKGLNDLSKKGPGGKAASVVLGAAVNIAERLLGMPTKVVGSFRFYLHVDGNQAGVFTEISGLQLKTEMTSVPEGGVNNHVHQLPGRTTVGNISLKRGMAGSDFLFRWYLKVVAGNIERKHVTIAMYDSVGMPLFNWDLGYAYPVSWTGPQLNAAAGTIAIESFELTHQGLIGSEVGLAQAIAGAVTGSVGL